MRKNNFRGMCRVTGIGSLPHRSPSEAVDFIFDTAPSLPYWPQLPMKDEREGMIEQFSRGLPGVADGSSTMDRSAEGFDVELAAFYERVIGEDLAWAAFAEHEASALFEVEQRSRAGDLPKVGGWKGQVTGPVTMGLQLIDEGKRFLVYDDTARQLIVEQLGAKARWLSSRLRALGGDETVVFLDEPLLYAYGSGHYNFPREHVVEMLREVLSRIDCVTGIHACSNVDWSLLLDAEPDIFSFDAFSFMDTFLIEKERVASDISSGMNIAWGVVPNTDGLYYEVDAPGLVERIDEGIAALSKLGVDERTILERSLITPACGVGSLDMSAAERVFDLCGEVSRTLSSRLAAV